MPVERGSSVVDRGNGLREFGYWLSTLEACDYLGYRGTHRLRSLYRFLQVNGVPVGRLSPRRLRIKRSDLDAVLRRGGKGRV